MKIKIEKIVQSILSNDPGVVVHYLLLRDLLKLPEDSSQLKTAKQNLHKSLQVQNLQSEQWQDGSWGAFHSRSTKLKQKIPSTEVGVARALTLGLDRNSGVLSKAENYISDLLQNKIKFPDYEEKNDRWETGKNLFLSSTLATINPDHPLLDEPRNLWLKILQRTFQSGSYKEDDEINAHQELTGATVKDSYLVLKSRYHLILLGSKKEIIQEKLQRKYFDWIWNQKSGISYLTASLNRGIPFDYPGQLDRWFASQELLSKYFPEIWQEYFGKYAELLFEIQTDNSFWDLGSRVSTQHYFPLSRNWKARSRRYADWTTRILILLRRYYFRIE